MQVRIWIWTSTFSVIATFIFWLPQLNVDCGCSQELSAALSLYVVCGQHWTASLNLMDERMLD